MAVDIGSHVDASTQEVSDHEDSLWVLSEHCP